MEDYAYGILLRLIFSHLFVDFILQTDKLVQGKSEKKCLYHVIHSLMQGVVAYLVVGCWSCWYILPVIFVTHFIIDYWKVSRDKNLISFIIDQGLHLLVILTLWFFMVDSYPDIVILLEHLLQCERFWIILIGFLVILKPTSLMLGLFTARWRANNAASQSLQNAGKWIGYLERVLILTFILIGKIEMIGFLLAAKSIFRFGELNKSKEIKTTEYVLIGTFASFTIAILWGLLLNKLIG